MTPARLGHRLGQQLLQYRQLHIGQALQVEAGLADFVLAELRQQGLHALEAGRQVKRQIRLAGSKADDAGLALMAAGVAVVVAVKPHDAGPPKHGLATGDAAHQLSQLHAILTARIALDRGQVGVETLGGGFGFGFGHGGR